MVSGYMTWLADAVRAAGLPVVEIGGWKTRGHAPFGEVWGVGGHHTAGPAVGDFPSLGILINGRTDLAGPLCQLGLSRSGVVYVIAAGVGWHMGQGSYPGIPSNRGNYHLIGIEPESSGNGDWTGAQLAAYPRLIAAVLRHLGLPEWRFIGHKEWRTSNPDPAGWPGDMNGMRERVGEILRGPSEPEAPTIGEHSMMIKNLEAGHAAHGSVALVSGGIVSGVDVAWAEETNDKAGGALVIGVSGAVWDDLVRKSTALESVPGLLADILAELRGGTS